MIANKKMIADFKITESLKLNSVLTLLKLRYAESGHLPEIKPGQFVQVLISKSPSTFLRRPISICNYIDENKEIWLLVRRAGKGTDILCDYTNGEIVNLIIPLGNGFSMPSASVTAALVGGGVGMAPLLLLGKKLREQNVDVKFFIGTRSVDELDKTFIAEFVKYGNVFISTEDGSFGEKGFITLHTELRNPMDVVYCCGPLPMMKAVASMCKQKSIECYVSLENMMACGIGACLCCVEKTIKGNLCVCTDGPVFNINQLTW